MIKLLNIFRKEKSPKISKMLLDVAFPNPLIWIFKDKQITSLIPPTQIIPSSSRQPGWN